MKTEIIKNCPFCGSAKVEISRTYHAWVSCAKCGAEAESHSTRAGAIRSWNRRSRKVTDAKVVYDADADALTL